MVLELKPRAIVGGVDDVGFLIELQFADGVDEATDFGVDVLDGIGVGILWVGVANVIGNVERDVGHGVGEVEEEGLVFVGLDEVDSLLRAAAGDGPLIDGEFDDFSILHERGVPFRQSGFRIGPEDIHSAVASFWSPLVVGVIHVVGVWDAEVGVEAVLLGESFGVMSEVPFAKGGRFVTLGFEVVSDGVFAGVETFLG